LLSAVNVASKGPFFGAFGYTKKMMSKTENHPSADSEKPVDVRASTDWRQVEAFVEQLHESAQRPIEAREFYRRLLEGCVTLLAAEGGVVWAAGGGGSWRRVCRVNCEIASARASHAAMLQGAAASWEPQILLPHSRGAAGGENCTAHVVALVAVRDASLSEQESRPHTVVELVLRPGSSPEVQQGWSELLATVAQVAADFHLHEQLRTLRAQGKFCDQSLALMRRLQQTTGFRQTVFEIANEGRSLVSGDRLSVVVRRGKTWQLVAASGVDRVENRADATKRLQRLAAATADWGEPLEYADDLLDDSLDGPPEWTELIAQHVDESQARRLVAVPIELVAKTEGPSRQSGVAAVLIAEQFSGDVGEFSRQRVLELAGLCEPALRQAITLDRFPVRSCLKWANRWAELSETWGLTKRIGVSVAALVVLLALVFVRCDFEVEASATLQPVVQRDIFAATDGKVIDVRITHGAQVIAGEVLAVLEDPQLSLEEQRVAGEIATLRKRLEAIAIARTDRQVREEVGGDRLPLSAEAEQLQRRLASLLSQQAILGGRREALTLRSPIAGSVLTLDLQNLLRMRPVERGQVLFTVADTTAGWRLLAELPQDRIGLVVAAQRKQDAALPVRFRFAGKPETTYLGCVESISTVAVLDTSGLDQASPQFEVKIQVEENDLPDARPGMNAQVRVVCGRRSLGYVWLHDVWETVYAWVVF